MDNPDRSVIRGEEAARLLENPILVDAITAMRDSIFREWESAPLRDTEGHYKIKVMLHVLTAFEKNLKNFVTDGKLASLQIEEEKKKLSFFRC